MLIGYARVSTNEQDTTAQASALKAAGCERIFREKATGGRWNRPELQRLLDHLRKGDVLVVWKLDRLSRVLAGCTDDHGADSGGEGGLPQPHGGDRHHDPGWPHDDADDWIVRRIRARHAARANAGPAWNLRVTRGASGAAVRSCCRSSRRR